MKCVMCENDAFSLIENTLIKTFLVRLKAVNIDFKLKIVKCKLILLKLITLIFLIYVS